MRGRLFYPHDSGPFVREGTLMDKWKEKIKKNFSARQWKKYIKNVRREAKEDEAIAARAAAIDRDSGAGD